MNYEQIFRNDFKRKSFRKKVNDIIDALSNKKVLIYGAGLSFEKINKKFDLVKKLNIVAISDKKFETNNHQKMFNIKTIKPNEIKNIDFDNIIITLERSAPIKRFLVEKLEIPKDKITTILEEEFRNI